jgi:hypothetical protein
VFLSVFFAVIFAPAGPFITMGPLLLLVVGWPEAEKWKIKNLLRVSSALLVVCFILLTRTAYVNFMTPPPAVDPKAQARQKTARH